jgi:hypothetical protein
MYIRSKSDEQLVAEAKIMCDFGGDTSRPEHREAAEAIAAYVAEQNHESNKMEERYDR